MIMLASIGAAESSRIITRPSRNTRVIASGFMPASLRVAQHQTANNQKPAIHQPQQHNTKKKKPPHNKKKKKKNERGGNTPAPITPPPPTASKFFAIPISTTM